MENQKRLSRGEQSQVPRSVAHVDRAPWLVSNLNIISMSRTRTHAEKWNEYITYTIVDDKAWEMAHILLRGELQIAFE